MSKPTLDSVLIIILNFNGWKETIFCIDTVLKQNYKNFHILLIDNGSKDKSLKKLDSFNDHVHITFKKEPINLGFAGGVNIGIKKAINEKYKYTVLLNNDAIITEDWLSLLVNSLQKTDASAVTGLLLDKTGKRIESTGDAYSNFGLPFPKQRDEDVSKAAESGYIFGGTAGASVYKTSLFEDIGLFDETFFAYFEDTDINYRAQLAGHTFYYEKLAIAYHNHGTTSSKMPGFTVYQTFKNLPILFWKDTPLDVLCSIGFRFYSTYALMYVRAVLRGQFVIATKGILKSISLFPHAIKERLLIQKNRCVTTHYIQSIIHHGLPPNTKNKGIRIFHR